MITDTATPSSTTPTKSSESSTPDEPTVSSALQEPTQPSTPESSPPANRTWVGVGVFILVIVLLIGGVLVYRTWSQTKTQSILDTTNSIGTVGENPLNKLGVIIRNAEGTELPLKQEIDQVQLSGAVRAAWDEALIKGSTNLVGFPNDPNLIAFRSTPVGASEPISLVLYKNRAIIVDTQPVPSLPDSAQYRLGLSSEDYQLVVKFEYTPEITELDVPTVLTEALNLAMSGNLDTPQAQAIAPIVAFDALVR